MGDSLSIPYFLLLSHCAIGLIAAQIAHQKGYDLGQWILLGTIGGTAALVRILTMPPNRD